MDLIDVQDVFGEQVILTQGRWQGHILASHPEVAPMLNEIRQALTQPDCVLQSDIHPETRLFYKRVRGQGRYANLYLKVAISYATQPATVRTAFLTGQMTGGRVLWLKFP